ncbi:MAG: RNA-directed DNA polymerase [Rhodospirillales bacterium]|nr:RNA-directed DNA polymerase [Rhodospirillales bacterium]
MNFPLHAYVRALKRSGASEQFIQQVRDKAKPLVATGLPVILTLGQLSFATEIPYRILLSIIGRAVDPYRLFSIRKRAGGRRFICVPEPRMMFAQRWIHQNILSAPSVTAGMSCAAMAYKNSASHVANARAHLASDWILKLDVTRFFESVSERQVYHVFHSLGYPALVAFGLARLCTRVSFGSRGGRHPGASARWSSRDRYDFLGYPDLGHLPQGAPSSPMLANLVCIPLDSQIEKIAEEHNLVYTRYADDLTLSGSLIGADETLEVIRKVSNSLGQFGFGVNVRKTRVVRRGTRMIVTGLSVEGETLRVPRDYKDRLRQELYYIEKFGLREHCQRIGQRNYAAYLRRLSSRIGYVSCIEPATGKKLEAKFTNLFPGFGELKELILSFP